MARMWAGIPVRSIDRVRLVALGFGMINLSVILVPSLAEPRVYSLVVALLIADLIILFARKRPGWWSIILVVAGPALAGITDSHTVELMGFSVALCMNHALYGTHRSVAARIVPIMAANAFVLIYTSLGTRVVDSEALTPALVVIPAFFALLMRTVATGMLRQEEAEKRENLVARAGLELSGVTSHAAVQATLHAALTDLCAMTPTLRIAVVSTGDDTATLSAMSGVAGLPDREAGGIGTALLGFTAADADPGDTGSTCRFSSVGTLDELAGRPRSGWWGFGMGTEGADQFLLAGVSRRRLPAGVLPSLRTLVTQVTMAHANFAAHAELTRLAHHDHLTTTPNRRAFFGMLTEAVDRSHRTGGELALLVIDLDDFKQVNDTFGHQAGDELLIELTERMRAAAGTQGITSRFGGDEFAILLTDFAHRDDADRVANHLRERLLEPVQLANGMVTVGASIGVVSGDGGATAGDLMRCADIAMYSAKAQGKNRVERFSEDKHGKIAQMRLLEDHLPHIVERDELVLHYQPVIDLKTGRCLGVEALARWNHPALGLLMLGDFLQVAERQGYIGTLGTQVLHLACRQLRAWSAEHPGLEMCVNVSSRQLTRGFAQIVQDAVGESGISPAQLVLDVCVTDAIEQDLAQAQLAEIADTGVVITLDDVGAGQISLAHLQMLGLSRLKIDARQFSNEISSGDQDLLQLIMSVSHFLHLTTVAKMIETPAQAAWARRTGIAQGQGFELGVPMSADELDQWLRQSRARVSA